MLGKLLKYELKASARTFLPLYLALIVVSIIAGISGKTSSVLAVGISGFVMGGLFISLFVATIMVIVQRFSKNLLQDEGYLMFTLPVSSKKLILSKCLSSCIYGILSFITAMIVILLVSASAGGFELFRGIGEAIAYVFSHMTFGYFMDAVFVIIMMLLSYLSFILIIYFVLSIGQLPVFNKHRKLASFITFFVVYILLSILQSFIPTEIFAPQYLTEVQHFYSNPNVLISFGFEIVAVLAFFFGTSYILDNKLNLE